MRHRVAIIYSSNCLSYNLHVLKRNVKNADWAGYAEYFHSIFKTLHSQRTFNPHMTYLYTTNMAADKHIPMYVYSQKPEANFTPFIVCFGVIKRKPLLVAMHNVINGIFALAINLKSILWAELATLIS